MTSPAVQRLRGLLAALALLAFVVGTPCGLLALGADPTRLIPDRWPDLAPISHWPERIWNTVRWAWLTGDLIAVLLVVVAWAGWLLLTLSVTAEVIRQTRQGVRTARGVLARVPRGRWIAGLVAAALVLISSGTASALPVTGSPIVATAPHRPPQQTHTHATAEPVSAQADSLAQQKPSRTWVDPSIRPDFPRITVHHGDTVWGLAVYHLGDGRRYHEIAVLNADRIPNPHELYPHDVLLLPSDAVNLPANAPDGRASARTVPVEPGDTLSAIAERELGDPDAWPALFDANRGLPQPDGRVLRHPDQLLPGWQIHLPAAAATRAASEPPAVPPSPAPPPPSSTPTAPAPPSNSSSPEQDKGVQADQHTPVELPGGGLVGLGLALSIAVLLVLARRRRRARRTPTGRLTPADRHPGPADPAGPGSVIATLDHAALRATHRHDAEWDDDSGDAVDRSDGVDALSAGRRRVWPPLAPVITVHTGTTARALDLSATGGLALSGPGAAPAVRAVLATVLAVDARYPAQALLADSAIAELVAGGDDLALRQAPGVEVTADETAALARLRTELTRRTRLRDDDQFDADLHPDESHQQRPGESTEPVLLLVAARPSPPHRREWATLLDQGRAVGIHALLLDDDHLHEAGDVTHLTLDVDGTITVAHGPGAEPVAGARAETLTPAEADEIWHLLAAARTPAPRQPRDDTTLDDQSKADDTPGVNADTPASSPHTTTASEKEPAVVVLLLGGVRVHARGSHVRGLRTRAREVLAYLAAHRHGTTADTLREAVLPDQPAARLHEAISHARSALRKATGENEAMFVLAESGRYRLDPDTLTADVWELEDVLTRARTSSDPDTRLEALRRLAHACRAGAPLQGAPYAWAEPVAEHWRSQAVDALVALASDVRDHNPDEALDALAVAIAWDPYTEALYRRTIALQRDLGRLDAAQATYRRLHANLRDIDLEPDPGTTALLDKTPVRQS
ncbi:LysM peptidoglycan-binding domain-containing protein [Amycolatopsis sp. K13G38]|uniref:LysM peptidoglycan-binding domain-containing protein n=1 Tax=Amycolatopsis acididurans TaxID=2724524 RepID=A0ABX1IWY6_9PSEU|nr:BTAD domain-containing putative transcriptional regulator [Amycolatopsis acididurans]NKQ51992.1 LysM peptidoglycan-binding domain-containing protein [Amycolatopsis acididurans]